MDSFRLRFPAAYSFHGKMFVMNLNVTKMIDGLGYKRFVSSFAATLVVYSFFATASVFGQVEFLGSSQLSGHMQDKSGLSGMLETNTPVNAFGGLSAIDYTGQSDRYVVLSDRGAGDGAASFPCRFHQVLLKVDPTNRSVDVQLESTSMLKDAQGGSLTGSLAVLKSWDRSSRCPSYDPEGIRCMGQSGVVISDEYGPHIDLFGFDGQFKKSFRVPEIFALSEKKDPPFAIGAFTNRGFEGVAISPDGRKIIAATQGPLVQDGRIENNKCFGLWTRWVVIDTDSGDCKQWVYPLEDESTGVSEVLWVDDHQFLVLERDSTFGEAAKIKRIYLVDSTHVSDVTEIKSLRQGPPKGTEMLRKNLMIDLLDPSYGFVGVDAPEKPEGITWGPKLADGRRVLVVCFDNDFDPEKPTIFAAFAVKL